MPKCHGSRQRLSVPAGSVRRANRVSARPLDLHCIMRTPHPPPLGSTWRERSRPPRPVLARETRGAPRRKASPAPRLSICPPRLDAPGRGGRPRHSREHRDGRPHDAAREAAALEVQPCAAAASCAVELLHLPRRGLLFFHHQEGRRRQGRPALRVDVTSWRRKGFRGAVGAGRAASARALARLSAARAIRVHPRCVVEPIFARGERRRAGPARLLCANEHLQKEGRRGACLSPRRRGAQPSPARGDSEWKLLQCSPAPPESHRRSRTWGEAPLTAPVSLSRRAEDWALGVLESSGTLPTAGDAAQPYTCLLLKSESCCSVGLPPGKVCIGLHCKAESLHNYLAVTN